MSATSVSDTVQAPAAADTTDPVVNIVTLNTTSPNTGDAILVTVNATDEMAVTSVIANNVELTSQGGNTWNGTIIALDGTHSVNVSAMDAAGNTGWNNSTSYKTPTSSGGSSSSGGGGSSGEEFENILISETERENVFKNSKISYSFDMDGNIVRYINFTGLTSAGRIAAKVEILNHTSALVEHAPVDIVYKNLNIFVGNLGWARPENIANPTVHFEVEKSWISENNIVISTITLNRYYDGKWNPVLTTMIGEYPDYLYFESQPPGFSPFAVTGKGGLEVTPTETEVSPDNGTAHPFRQKKSLEFLDLKQ